MEYVKGDRIECVWYMPGVGKDFLGILYKKAGEEQLSFDYRFRYYVDDKAFDSKDRKEWHRMATKEPLGLAISNVDMMLKILRTSPDFPEPADKVLVGGGFEAMVERLKGKEWFHVKTYKVGKDA